jgi:hypothetical protein
MKRGAKIERRARNKPAGPGAIGAKMDSEKSVRVSVRELEQLRRNTIGTLSIIDWLLREEKSGT